jgi:hypothetical protein
MRFSLWTQDDLGTGACILTVRIPRAIRRCRRWLFLSLTFGTFPCRDRWWRTRRLCLRIKFKQGGAQFMIIDFILKILLRVCVHVEMWINRFLRFDAERRKLRQPQRTELAHYKTRRRVRELRCEVYLKRGVCLKHTKCAEKIRMWLFCCF